jgi:hypothetical protein
MHSPNLRASSERQEVTDSLSHILSRDSSRHRRPDQEQGEITGLDTLYQWIDLAEARSQGIMPIPYAAAK